ncbi:MAG: biotin operon repressor, partial [Acetivibrio ethanolgignens]
MMKKKVLTLLKEADGYLSGQDICEKLEVSRTAIWKVMKQLREEGYQIESASNRGYRLLEVPDRLTEAELGSRLENSLFGKNIIYKEEIDST